MKIFSSAFSEGSSIPCKYSCDEKELSIPLQWEDVPAQTQSLALIMDDPDAPMGTWVHWVLYNLPADIRELPQGQSHAEVLPNGGLQGRNTAGDIGYAGPCPPDREHRYFFKLFALDCVLDSKPGLTKAELLDAMAGHVLTEAQTFGVYNRK